MLANIKALKSIVFQINYILTSSQRRKALLVCVSMIIISVLELLSVSMIYPFLNLMIDGEKIKQEWYIRWIYYIYPQISFRGLVLLLGICIMLVFILKNIIAILLLYMQSKFAAMFRYELASKMLASYLRRPYEFFTNNNSAELLRGVNEDPGSVYNLIIALFQALGELITIAMIGGYLLYASWDIALFALLLSAACFLYLTHFFKKRIKQAGRTNRSTSVKKNQYSLQAINGIKEIIIADRRELFIDRYNEASLANAKTTLTYSFLGACPDRILEGICMSGFMGIVCVRVLLGVEYATFIPTLGVFAMGAFKILPSISKLSSRVNTIIYNQPGLKHCYDNIMEARHIDSEALIGNSQEKESDIKFRNIINVRNVVWKYANSNNVVLEKLSLTIKKGEAVAFIGKSGAGKTTLADVILGLFEPQSGCVEMDGINVFSIPHEWSKIIGYVPQNVYLIDDTIRANVAFGIPGEDVSDTKIWAALKQAQMDNYVKELPDGLDTMVGERGVRFSGGQRQRIAIARALYEDPDILVLDEATSALDNETERAVMESIEKLHGTKTLIIIAHRLSTIKKCDRIIEIKDGKAIEQSSSLEV